jgi:hypothetical protein
MLSASADISVRAKLMVDLTLDQNLIEAKAREWRDMWVSHWGTNDQSWIALVRHVLTQSAPRPEDVEEVAAFLGITWEDDFGGLSAFKVLARAIIARYGPPPPITPVPETRDAETLARDWYECAYPGLNFIEATDLMRKFYLNTVTRFLALPHRAPAPLPIGTIVVGEGLTEAQTTLLPSGKLIDADATSHAANALEGFHWDCTVEGLEFWRTIRDRLSSMSAALRASAAPKHPEPMIDVAGFTIEHSGPGVRVTTQHDSNFATPAQARALAAALVAQADAAEAG